MTDVSTIEPQVRLRPRTALARDRAAIARAMLSDCHFCAHHCGANRLAVVLSPSPPRSAPLTRLARFAGEGGLGGEGQTQPAGLCHAGANTRFFHAQVEVSDELELIPTFDVETPLRST